MLRDIDTEWIEFCAGNLECNNVDTLSPQETAPKSTPLYISTKTKICHLSAPIDLVNVFWRIQIIPYSTPTEGIIKKQMKFCSTSPEDLSMIEEKLQEEMSTYPNFVNNQIISHVENPNGMIKFKDIRKLSIGLSKKEIVHKKCKQKSAFYNCFVLVLRVRYNASFKEINVKVFNTGKLEIPGIQQDDILEIVLNNLTKAIAPIVNSQSFTHLEKNDTVLINSNFKCNYLIVRDNLVDILKTKYNIKCSYDPCSYPGIQCTFFYDARRTLQTGVQPSDNNFTNKVSIMIFRTGSVLIVGRCTENILYEIYDFVRKLLETEYHSICDDPSPPPSENTPTRKRQRSIYILV